MGSLFDADPPFDPTPVHSVETDSQRGHTVNYNFLVYSVSHNLTPFSKPIEKPRVRSETTENDDPKEYRRT